MDESLKAQLQATLDMIPAFTWLSAPSGALLFVNSPCADYLGLPQDHPLRFGTDTGAAWDSHVPFLHPDDHEEARRASSDNLKTGSSGDVSLRIRNAKGNYRWFLTRTQPLRATDGTVQYWIGVNLDIEERKQAEFYLAEGQRLAHTGSWTFTAAGFAHWSTELFAIYGLDPHRAPPSIPEYMALVHPDDREFVAQEIQTMLTEHRGFDFTKRIVRSDGSIRHVRCVGTPTRPGGVVQSFVGTGIDVTEHEVLTRALRKSEEELRQVLNLAPQFIAVFGRHRERLFMNRSGLDYFGLTLDEWRDKPPVCAVSPPDDAERVKAQWDRAMSMGSAFESEVRFRKGDGSYRWFLARYNPLRDEQGQIARWYVAGTDIEDRKRAEEALRRSEHCLAEAQRLSHTGSFGWNVSTDEHFWSDETFRIFEFDPSSKVSLPMILACVHPQDMPAVEDAIAAATRAEGIDLEIRLLMPDGRNKYLHVVGKAEKRETGSVEVIGAVMDVTAQTLTEVELRRSRAHLTDAQRLSHVGSVGMEASTQRIFWSEESARIYGYAPGTEPTPDLILRRVHPDDVGLVEHAIERAGRGGDDFDYEHRLLMPDGSIKHIYNLAHCYRDEAGNAEVVGAIMDITERRVTEEAIRRSEAYLAEAQGLSHTGSFGWKPDEGEIVWSHETYRIFEYDSTLKPTVDSVVQRVHPSDRAIAQQVIDRASRTGTDFELEHRLLLADGRVKHVHAIARAMQDASGHREFIGAVTDITERKTAEEKVRAQEAELRQILDFVPQLVGVLGPHAERLYANRITLSYLGVTLDEWRQGDRQSDVHPDDVDRIKAHIDRSLTTGAAGELEIRLRGADGTYRWFLVRSNPLRDDQGQLVRWYIAYTDIDDRKKTEEKLQQENVALREEIDKTSMFEEIVGTSPALTAVLSRVSKVASSDSTVLISGETGTGKELVARAIHRRSRRASRAFVAVNCAAIPRDLIASELFGHEKGAFTGALQRRLGRFELADGGTIFLDEVGELAPDTQVALLRVLQEREFERVGGQHPIRVDVRVVAATNRDLTEAVAEGTFRQDLFYRLNVFPLEMPPLRERQDDIAVLVEYFVNRYARKAGKTIRRVSKRTLDLLKSYPWPGNVRELQNVIERSAIVSETDEFTVDESWLSTRVAVDSRLGISSTLASHEKALIEDALRATGGRVFGASGAAARLGIPRSTLESKIRALRINKSRFRTRSPKRV
jgi:PAS domain S-box-containing protein